MMFEERALTEAGFQCHSLEDGCVFYEGRVPAALLWNEALFEDIWRLHPETSPVITMVGKKVAIPRYQMAYGADYYFSGQTSRAHPVPELLLPLLTWTQTTLDTRFNGLLVNWYEGPGHYIGPHHDSEKNMPEGTPIVTISFGEPRLFRLQQQTREGKRRVCDFRTVEGGVFVLPRTTNRAWKHAVPKSARYRGRRISVTIRAFLEDETAEKE